MAENAVTHINAETTDTHTHINAETMHRHTHKRRNAETFDSTHTNAETFDTTCHFFKTSSQAKVPKRKFPSEISQAKDPKRTIPSERSQAKDNITNVMEIIVRVTLV